MQGFPPSKVCWSNSVVSNIMYISNDAQLDCTGLCIVIRKLPLSSHFPARYLVRFWSSGWRLQKLLSNNATQRMGTQEGGEGRLSLQMGHITRQDQMVEIGEHKMKTFQTLHFTTLPTVIGAQFDSSRHTVCTL